jgi:hypothetical protein
MHEGRVVADDAPQALKRRLHRADAPEPTLEDVFAALLGGSPP